MLSCVNVWPAFDSEVEDASVFYPAIVTPDDGAFVVTFPDAPGCVTQVDTVEQLMPMATEALAGWLDATLDSGDSVPEPRAAKRAPGASRGILGRSDGDRAAHPASSGASRGGADAG